jgi:hypothetical protein
MCHAKSCSRYRKSVRRDVIESAFSELLKRMVPSMKLVELARAMFAEAWKQRGMQTAQMVEGFKRERTRIDKESQRLIDLILGSTSPEVAKAYEQRVSELERQKLFLDEKREYLDKKRGSFEELFELAISFLSRPYDLAFWQSAPAEIGA